MGWSGGRRAHNLSTPCHLGIIFSVPPRNKKTVEIECPPSRVGELTVVVEGWNVRILSLGANATGKNGLALPEFKVPAPDA